MWTSDTLEWIDIELTSFCNIRCKGCFRVESSYADKILNKTYLEIETIKEKSKEIFGEIDDEHDLDDQDHKQLSENEFEFSGRTEIDFINEKYRRIFNISQWIFP